MANPLRRRGRAEAPRSPIARQIALLCMVVCTVAALLAGLASYRLQRSAVDNQTQRNLATQADLLANTLDGTSGVRRPVTGTQVARLPAIFAKEKVAIINVAADGTQSGGLRGLRGAALQLTPAEVTTLTGGGTLDMTTRINGLKVFLEGRPLTKSTTGEAVVLVQDATQSSADSSPLLKRTAFALLLGLVAAAIGAAVLARRLARPLQQAASAAHALAAGDRSIRVEPSGSSETAEVALALNALATALTASEGRQREFLLSVSHELRTPLTGIKGFAEALADDVVAPEDVAATGATVLEEADRLQRLVSDLLDLARLGADDVRVDLVEVDVLDVVAQAARVWQRRCDSEGVWFRTEVPKGPVRVVTDPVRLRQVLDGLLENALRVTPADAPIVVSVDPDVSPLVTVRVRDGGPGLTEDDCAVAFDRSVLYDRYRGVRRVGTGLGLAIVHGLVTRLGGEVAAGRSPEGGAMFTVRLPLQGAPPAPGTNRARPGVEGPEHLATIGR